MNVLHTNQKLHDLVANIKETHITILVVHNKTINIRS